MRSVEAIETSDLLLDYLERERRAIISGNWDVLDRMASEKQRLTQMLQEGSSVAELRTVRKIASQNQMLLHAVRRGMERVMATVSGARPGADLVTYGKNGVAKEICGSRPEKSLRL